MSSSNSRKIAPESEPEPVREIKIEPLTKKKENEKDNN